VSSTSLTMRPSASALPASLTAARSTTRDTECGIALYVAYQGSGAARHIRTACVCDAPGVRMTAIS
jgi:hypothetical protein